MDSKVPYYKIRAFDGIYLEDSYLLTIEETPSKIVFFLETVVLENHKLYSKPDNEHFCYRKAKMIFSNYLSLNWIEKIMKPIVDLDQSIDYGNIDVFYKENNRYYLEGEWGKLEIISMNEPSIDFE
jgi:hypothetical protein